MNVVVAHALLRSGSSATYVTDDSGAPLLLDDAGGGLVPDLCRRVLEMPTAPPELETGVYLSRLWLDRLLEAAAARPGCLQPEQALALHPAEQAQSFGFTRSWLQLALATHEFAVAAPWAVLRRRFAAAGGDDRASQAARWFDDGSFSRWMLDRLPSPAEALAALAELVPAAALREVRATIELAAELGVDDDLLEDDQLDDDWFEGPDD